MAENIPTITSTPTSRERNGSTGLRSSSMDNSSLNISRIPQNSFYSPPQIQGLSYSRNNEDGCLDLSQQGQNATQHVSTSISQGPSINRPQNAAPIPNIPSAGSQNVAHGSSNGAFGSNGLQNATRYPTVPAASLNTPMHGTFPPLYMPQVLGYQDFGYTWPQAPGPFITDRPSWTNECPCCKPGAYPCPNRFKQYREFMTRDAATQTDYNSVTAGKHTVADYFKQGHYAWKLLSVSHQLIYYA